MTAATPESLARELHAAIDDLPEAGYDDQIDRAHSLVDDLVELAEAERLAPATTVRIGKLFADGAIAWRSGNGDGYLTAAKRLMALLDSLSGVAAALADRTTDRDTYAGRSL